MCIIITPSASENINDQEAGNQRQLRENRHYTNMTNEM